MVQKFCVKAQFPHSFGRYGILRSAWTMKKLGLKNLICSVSFPFESPLFCSNHGSHLTYCVPFQNCSFWNNKASISCKLLRTSTITKRNLDTPLHYSIKCLTILQRFTLFLICDLWFLRRGFQDTFEPMLGF